MLASTREDEAPPVDLGFGQCVTLFKNHHGDKQRLKAQTLQPDGRMFLMQKYFNTAISPWAQPTTYANVPIERDTTPVAPAMHQPHQDHHGHHQRQPSRHSHRSHNHQHLHARSHSQHYYQPMLSQGLNDPNCYYNVAPPGVARSRHSPINEPLHPIHNQPAQLDCITVMQVCNELGNNIDSSPPMPSSRKYSISNIQGGLLKIAFPQTRTMKVDFRDHVTRTFIKSGETISVLEPSKEDRSKFTVCYKDKHIDLPHQFTQPSPIHWNLAYNQGYGDSHNLTLRH